MDAVTMAAEIRARRLSPVEVTQAVLERMERLEPTLHAYCTPTPELAMETARRVEAAIADGQQVGPLAGVPVAVKDLICTRGIRTVSGSRAYEDFVPDEDDVVVERLRAADAVILGKTNVPEFGYSGVGHNPVFTATRNPWNTDLTSGGSSAGSGAAVAAGMGPLALGSDGGGSIRIPSSFCGLYGLKASMGRVPLYPGTKDERLPGVSSWESLEHIGPMTRTVADSALLMSVIAGPDPRDRFSVPAGTSTGPAVPRAASRASGWPTARTGAMRRSTPACAPWSTTRWRPSSGTWAAPSSGSTPAGRIPTRPSGPSWRTRATCGACARWWNGSGRTT
jgi:aspartyl-tRNA(Asn)/glutamyl-tRNA(Gln) amidotransferase subunit A